MIPRVRCCRRSLLARALAVNVVLLMATGTVITGIFLIAMREVVIRQAALRAASVARAIADRAQFSMLVGDRTETATVARETLLIKDVVFVVVTDKDGSTIRVKREGFPEAQLPATAWSAEATGASARWGRGEYIDAAQPVEHPDAHELLGMEAPTASDRDSLGAICVGLSLQQAREDSLAAAEKALAVAAGFMALILALQWRQFRRLLIPVRSLAQFTSTIARETLDRRALVTGDDEVAELATAFNHMLDRLAATLVSKDLAEQANQAKGRFLATASHELRTPLNAIIGYSELIEEEMTDMGMTQPLPDLRKIRNSGQMLLDLVNDLLDYSKAEAGRTQLRIEAIRVRDVIQEVADAAGPLTRSNRNRLDIELPDEYLMARADRGKFRQSLLNLVGNACKFTEDGSVCVSAARAGSSVRIDVRDTGIGMSPADIGKLFEAFVQLDSSTTRKHGGSGLGLAVSRKFCRRMNGDITVESEPGRGSVFTIWLPAAVQETSPSAETNTGAIPAAMHRGEIS